MKIISLASSSKGNCILYQKDKIHFMIDFGISVKKCEEKLNRINKKIDDIDFIIITHEHLDHSKGLKMLIKKNPNIKVFLTNGTYQGLKEKLNISDYNFQIINYFEKLKINEDLKLIFLPNSHDANEPNSVAIYENIKSSISKKYIHCTDTGYIKEEALEYMYDADIYLIESNYDYNLLYETNRPLSIKNRINSNEGHLNNNVAASYINKLMNSQKSTKWAILHVSNDANNKTLIEKSIIENIENIDKIEVIICPDEEIKEIE